jgi:Zn-dependent peptidase ImmA (M78 family)
MLADESDFPTSTMMGVYDMENDVVLIKGTLEMPDMFFSIAHELRHIWQTKQGEGVTEYRTITESNKVDYNLQDVELDANAFATRVMVELFGVRPLFSGMPENVVNEIYRRANTQEISQLFV